MKACKKATKSSRKLMMTAAIVETNPTEPVRNQLEVASNAIMPNIVRTASIVCPPTIFANKRIARAAGLMNMPINSIGNMIGNKYRGAPPVK